MGYSETPSDYKQGLAVDFTDTLATIYHTTRCNSSQDLKSQNSNPGQPSSSQSLRFSSSFHSIRCNRRRARQEKITCQTYFTRNINFSRNEIPMTPHHTHTIPMLERTRALGNVLMGRLHPHILTHKRDQEYL